MHLVLVPRDAQQQRKNAELVGAASTSTHPCARPLEAGESVEKMWAMVRDGGAAQSSWTADSGGGSHGH